MTTKPYKFLETLKGQTNTIPPFWFMRQAGRYLPEYRKLRADKGGFLAMAMDPSSACEITMQPIRRFQMDAAIIFSDILVIPMALGQDLEFVQGEGPKLNKLETAQDISALNDDNYSCLDPVFEALQRTRKSLSAEGFNQTALIGFAGAPWTVATYMIEGGSSKDFINTKLMAYQNPEAFSHLIDILVKSTARYLIDQVDAGAQALQIFDSWAGALDSQGGFERWCINPIKKIVETVKSKHPDVPIIGFPKGAGYNYLEFAKKTGVTALGLDQHVPSNWAAKDLQTLLPVQGNLDPFILMAGGQTMENAVRKIKSDFAGKPYIFNLGHGIHKDTPVENVEHLVKLIKEDG